MTKFKVVDKFRSKTWVINLENIKELYVNQLTEVRKIVLTSGEEIITYAHGIEEIFEE